MECSAQTVSGHPAIAFTDVTQAVGITFVHFKGNQGTSINLEEFGPGVCVADFDGDGWPDIYFVNGRDRYNRGISVRNALYRNNGNGTFTDVTDKAGVPGTGYGLGCVWGDYDNDGYPDLFVTQYGTNVLYHNNGDGTFTDVTMKAGVAGLDSGKFHSSAAFFDYDRDGYLDLYVGSYVQLEPDGPRYCTVAVNVKSSCPPQAYKGSLDALYRNNGDGTFTNVTQLANVYQPKGKNLAVGVADYKNNGWPDLFVANDGMPSYLYLNERGTFRETGFSADMAYSIEGRAMAAMCVSFGDYDNDGWLDLYMSDFLGYGDHLWHNDHNGHLREVTGEAGIFLPTLNVLSFGGGFFDYDNDGWLDLFIANGHVYPEVEVFPVRENYRQLNSVFHNQGSGKFIDSSKTTGVASLSPRVGRGVAFADFDNDGFVDVVVANNDDSPTLLHNSGNSNHFINFKLVGTKSNRDGIGARIRVIAGGLSQIREIASGGSYLSQSDLRANFGLGHAVEAQRVEISWPSGQSEHFSDVKADKFYLGGYSFAAGTAIRYRPNVTAGIPLELFGSQYPGGKIINNTPGAIPGGCPDGSASIGPFCPPPSGQQGNFGRNVLRGYGATQADIGFQRLFRLTENVQLRFRGEFFNIFNHPNFGPQIGDLTSSQFGYSTATLNSSLGSGGANGGLNPLYQVGGPRSIQLALKLQF